MKVYSRFVTPNLSAAPSSPTTGELYFDTTASTLYWWSGSGWVAAKDIPSGGPSLVTSLPGSPTDGQECYFQVDATNGIIWHFRYRTASGSAYKWEYLGGPPMQNYVAGQSVGSGAWTAPTGVAAPTITLPALAGDFDIEIGAGQFFAASGGQQYRYGVGIGAANPVDPAIMYVQSPTATFLYGATHKARMTGLAASAVLTNKLWTASGAPSATFQTLRATPVRVG